MVAGFGVEFGHFVGPQIFLFSCLCGNGVCGLEFNFFSFLTTLVLGVFLGFQDFFFFSSRTYFAIMIFEYLLFLAV